MTAARVDHAGEGVPDVQVWHDEFQRWQQTGHLDQGPCWCPRCIEAEATALGVDTP